MDVELPSQTSIANNAISRVGSTETVTSIETQTPTAQRIRGVWPQLRRGMLVQHPFNFAIWRQDLNAAAGAGLPAIDDGLFAYRLPADCLRWLPPAAGDRGFFSGELESGFILTGRAAPIRCRYIRDVPDVTRWSAGFVEAFTEALAKWLAQPVTQSATMAQWLHDTTKEAVRLAKRLDGLETGRVQRGQVVRHSDWLTARGRTNMSGYR